MRVSSSISAILSSVIVISIWFKVSQPEPTQKIDDGRPAAPPAARCATPGAPRAASYTNPWDTTKASPERPSSASINAVSRDRSTRPICRHSTRPQHCPPTGLTGHLVRRARNRHLWPPAPTTDLGTLSEFLRSLP